MTLPFFNLILLPIKEYDRITSIKAMEACEQVMAEMGAEIHDDLIQKLALLQLDLHQIQRLQDNPSEVLNLIVKMEADFKVTISSVRRISRRLMPVGYEEDSFTEQIEMLCQNMEHPGASHIHFETSGGERILANDVSKNLYRMIQELMHNAFRHSSAWHIWVRLEWSENQLIIEVEDDGTAFSKLLDVIKQLKSKNNSLRMRSEAIGAKLEYQQGKKGLLARIHYDLKEKNL